MPVASSLPQRHVVLRFPPGASRAQREGEGEGEVAEETYQLLELPAEILKQVEGIAKQGDGGVFPLTIKGRPSDDAVLCTPTNTFTLRTVGISNSLLVCRNADPSTAGHGPSSSSSSSSPTLQVRDTCHQILECVPIAPNLERIRTVLRDSAWQGIGSSETPSLGKRKRAEDKGQGKGKGKSWTREQLASVIQASEVELDKGLKERNVVEVEGRMLLLPPGPLRELLTLILSLLAIHHVSPSTPHVAPSSPILKALQDEHEVPPSIARAVLSLFGQVQEHDSAGEWAADTRAMVRQVGLGLIQRVRDRRADDFLEEWKVEVGEMWADQVDLSLLEGDHLLTPAPPTLSSFTSPSPLLTHFPLSSLPPLPITRFADLFLTRPRWRPDEMLPFLRGLTRDGDTKERDKLVQKFVRVVKDKDGGAWWYPRRTG